MGDGWLWVTSQSTGLSGIVNQELVQELVGIKHMAQSTLKEYGDR